MKFSNLTTERLFLRELQPGDAEQIFRLRSDDSVNQFVDRARAVTIDDAHNFIQMIQTNAAKNEGMMWAVTLIGDSKLIGTIVYWHIEWENCKAEIGYEMLPEYQGKGLMTEALKKVLEFGSQELQFSEIKAEPKEKNEKS